MSVSNLQLVSDSNNSVRLTYAGSALTGAIQWQAVNAGTNGALLVTPLTGFAPRADRSLRRAIFPPIFLPYGSWSMTIPT